MNKRQLFDTQLFSEGHENLQNKQKKFSEKLSGATEGEK